MTAARRRVLVIKLGALGDFVLATGPFAAIRRHHAEDELVLLTTAPFSHLAGQSGWFDEVWIDERPRSFDLPGVLRLGRRLRRGGFARVYDLQTSDRSSFYYRLFPAFAKPEWSGIAAGCSHPHANPGRDAMHTIDRQAEQLAAAGIAETPPPDLSWLHGDLSRFALPDRYAMIIPGAAPHRPAKRWPEDRFAAVARLLEERGMAPVVVGGPGEHVMARTIAGTAGGLSLAGRTSLGDVADLARGAVCAVGNDTGPMHIAAICGCRSVVLFSRDSDPSLTAPRGRAVTILKRPNLADLDASEVAAALSLR